MLSPRAPPAARRGPRARPRSGRRGRILLRGRPAEPLRRQAASGHGLQKRFLDEGRLPRLAGKQTSSRV